MKINLICDSRYRNWVFDPTHPTQGRRFTTAEQVLDELAAAGSVELVKHPSRPATAAELGRLHTPGYIAEVMEAGLSGEWAGSRPEMAELASLFLGGTMRAVELALAGELTVAHLPGAKHHARAERSSGFCVFADFATAATVLADEHGRRVAVLDIDVHHGDGTEELTRDHRGILTFSVHQGGIFPGTGRFREDDLERHVHNRPLPAGAGDDELVVAVQEFVDVAKDFGTDFVMLAAGADGHAADPLGELRYSEDGFAHAVGLLRAAFPDAPIVMGGAGGYRPDDHTPGMWLHALCALAGHGEREIASLGLLDRVAEVVAREQKEAE